MYEICPETAADEPEVENLYDLCFAPGRTALSSYRLRDGVPKVADLCLVLRDPSRTLMAAIRFWPVRVARRPVLLLGPIAVHPTAQGEGLGGMLMRDSLGRAQAWVGAGAAGGDAPYYSRFGFRRLDDVVMPPPTNPDRVLGLELHPGAWVGLAGPVTRETSPGMMEVLAQYTHSPHMDLACVTVEPLMHRSRKRIQMAAIPQLVLPPINDPSVHVQIDRLAERYLHAGGLGMELMAVVGNSAEGLIEKLPGFVRGRMDRITRAALGRAFAAASRSRRMVRDRGDWFNRLASTVSGAAGGVGGFAGAVVELPVTITLLLRAMLDIAAEHGLDPQSEEVRLECLRIFAAAGPMAEDDTTDLGLLAARLSVTGQTVQGLITKVAPKLSVSMGQKLAAQAAPIFGAVVGASINYTFTRYYQELARVHFGIMRLSHETGIPKEALIEALRLSINRLDHRHAER